MSVAVIFDMDGVIVDNGEYHQQAWKEFSHKYGLSFSEEKFKNEYFGRTNEHVLPEMFGKKLSKQEIKKLATEKEEIYRKIYRPHLKPVDGLISFLDELHDNNTPMAIATSAPIENVDFVLKGLGIEKYIEKVITDSMVSKGKPNPEIYLKAAEMLGTKPGNCVVFEDSLSGTKAAWQAGAKVIALTTTLPASKHKYAHRIMNDFKMASIDFIQSLFTDAVE